MKYDYAGDYDGDLWQTVVNKVMELEAVRCGDFINWQLLLPCHKQSFYTQLVKNKS
jgi:hypothetical protein